MENYPVASPLWSKRKVKRELKSLFLPDEIVIHILIRLQVKDVLQCRCVCKRWRDLSSTPDFLEFHYRRGGSVQNQMILVEEPKGNYRKDHYFIDKWWLSAKNKFTFTRNPLHAIKRNKNCYPRYITQFSQEGLVVMQSTCRHRVLIVNPVTREEVRIVDRRRGDCLNKVYGLFFNPKLKEYCVLFGIAAPAPYTGVYYNQSRRVRRDYKILNLGPNPCWRDISNPWNSRDRFQKSIYATYQQWACPVLVGECLYWMVDPDKLYRNSGHGDIMEFDIKNDKFTLLEYPFQRNAAVYDLSQKELVNIDGYLSLVQISKDENLCNGNIWTLKDHVWTKSNFCTNMDICPYTTFIGAAKAIAVEYGEIVIRMNETLFACSLKQRRSKRTSRFIGKNGKKAFDSKSMFFSYVTSLSSLKNCKPIIHIEGEDENDEKINECQVCDSLDRAETSRRVGKQSNFVESDVVEDIKLEDHYFCEEYL